MFAGFEGECFPGFCGHCRQAAVVARAALEMLVFGSYFQSVRRRNVPGANALWENWVEGNRDRPRFGHACGELARWKIITPDARAEVMDLYYDLSMFAHTFVGDDVYRFMEDRTNRLVRPSSAIDDDVLFVEWFRYILRLFSLVVRIVRAFPLGSRAEVQESLGQLQDLVAVLEREVAEAVRFTDCLGIEEINQW